MKGWAPRFALRKRLKVIRKWPFGRAWQPWRENFGFKKYKPERRLSHFQTPRISSDLNTPLWVMFSPFFVVFGNVIRHSFVFDIFLEPQIVVMLSHVGYKVKRMRWLGHENKLHTLPFSFKTNSSCSFVTRISCLLGRFSCFSFRLFVCFRLFLRFSSLLIGRYSTFWTCF